MEVVPRRPWIEQQRRLGQRQPPRQAAALQARIKALFDPYGRFPEFTPPPNSDSL
ncbi:hypothetical protein [Achromobacter insuavis]|uniref:hypothetical protein n=1 Tax=Achromobacter insuavis TaxID=1287735 RepID=UPI001F144B65|nr:hypothetical protein [Achromobacter insuavis]